MGIYVSIRDVHFTFLKAAQYNGRLLFLSIYTIFVSNRTMNMETIYINWLIIVMAVNDWLLRWLVDVIDLLLWLSDYY